MNPLIRSLVLLAVLASSAQATTTILDDRFSDGSRTDQNLPSSAAWYTSIGSSNLSVSGSSLQWINSATGNAIIASVPSQTLTAGQTLTLSFTFSAIGVSSVNNGFRVGLFNNGSTSISADGWAATTFTSNGYGASANLGTDGVDSSYLWYRNGNSGVLFNGPSLTPESGTSATGPDLNLTSSQTYTGIFTITNNGASNAISYSIFSGSTAILSLSATDTHGYNNFDTIAFIMQPNSATSINFTEISLTSSAVPESRSVTLGIGGMIVVAWLGMRRRSRAAASGISMNR